MYLIFFLSTHTHLCILDADKCVYPKLEIPPSQNSTNLESPRMG